MTGLSIGFEGKIYKGDQEISWLDLSPEMQDELLQTVRNQSEELYLKERRAIIERTIKDTLRPRHMGRLEPFRSPLFETSTVVPRKNRTYGYEG